MARFDSDGSRPPAGGVCRGASPIPTPKLGVSCPYGQKTRSERPASGWPVFRFSTRRLTGTVESVIREPSGSGCCLRRDRRGPRSEKRPSGQSIDSKAVGCCDSTRCASGGATFVPMMEPTHLRNPQTSVRNADRHPSESPRSARRLVLGARTIQRVERSRQHPRIHGGRSDRVSENHSCQEFPHVICGKVPSSAACGN